MEFNDRDLVIIVITFMLLFIVGCMVDNEQSKQIKILDDKVEMLQGQE